ncbi:MAG: efflux RND transporter periplasmic adaptor subunit [Acidaminococcales bacterium]|jgi:RND family efflux transporter MFP subunit|nr:efflux RND transporter periplasmic adaptor subunit [Acidaminococcales bacterium]
MQTETNKFGALGGKNRKVWIAALAAAVILAIVAFRIYANMRSNQERAARVFQGAATPVEISVVERRDIAPTLLFSANLEPVWSADLSPKLDSRLDRLFVDEGDFVKAGQVVAQMDVLELSAQAFQSEGLLYEALSESSDAAIEYERNQKLFEQNAISKRELDNSRFRRDMTLGRHAAAQGALKVLRERIDAAAIRSPRDGVVTRRYIYAGYYVKSGSPIVSVADTTTLLAQADVSEGQIAGIYMDAQAEVSVAAYSDRAFSGRVSRISPMAAQPARTFKTEITIPNKSGELKAGMFARVAIRGKLKKGAVAIPQSAIVMREDQQTVYLVNDEDVVQQVLLETGAVENGFVEVLKGLSGGERIVTGGQNKLRQGVKIARGSTDGAGSGK